MKRTIRILIGLFIIASNFIGAQTTALCVLQTDIFSIENSANIPTVTINGDDTITLTFPDQFVTDVFANHIIYDFYQAFPNTSETLEKYYNITYDSRLLIEDVITNVPLSIIQYDGEINTTDLPFNTSVSLSLIDLLDGRTYDLTKYRHTSDADDCYGNCTLYDVPNDFMFRVIFTYNAETELLIMESESLSSCGNYFSIGLTGGNPNEFGVLNNTLQLWNSTPITSSVSEYTSSCYEIESTLFAILDIACSPNDYAFGNISVIVDSEYDTVRFEKANMVFGYHMIEFSGVNLSVDDQSFQHIKPFEIANNPYLQIANFKNQLLYIEIYNASGQQIVQSTLFKENTLNISNLSEGLYFIRILDVNNQHKTFKFLKK